MKIEFLCDLKKIKDIATLRKINLSKFKDDDLLEKAENMRILIEKKWKKHESNLIVILNEILPKLDNKLKVKVYIFPDEIPVGACNCNTKEIFFGYKEEYEGFSLVTICHEIAHILIYKYRKEKIISRVTDETIAFLVGECEIRKKLTGQEYFSNFFSGELSDLHKEAVYVAKENINIWNKYLEDNERDLDKLLVDIEKNISKSEKDKYRTVKLKEFLN